MNYIYKSILFSIISVTLFYCKDDTKEKTVSVGIQDGTIKAGEEGVVAFPVTTTHIVNGTYSINVSNLPVGVSANDITITDNNGVLTLTGNTTTVEGITDNLTLTIDGTTSKPFELEIMSTLSGKVYVAGYLEKKGVLWIDNVPHIISPYGSCHAVCISDNNVYVAGREEFINYETIIKLWKNGIEQPFQSNRVSSARVLSLSVSGNDVYVLGDEPVEMSPGSIMVNYKFWKNGIEQNLPDADAEFMSLYVSGNDVYITGYSWNTYYMPKLWKNGIDQGITGGNYNGKPYPGFANSVFISDNDVYVAGITFEPPEMKRFLTLWKNGVPQHYESNLEPHSLFVSGNDVYMCGFVVEDGNEYAKLFVNGVEEYLPDGARAVSVYVADNNVYVAGYKGWSRYARFWINGKEQNIAGDGESSGAYSVFVVEK